MVPPWPWPIEKLGRGGRVSGLPGWAAAGRGGALSRAHARSRDRAAAAGTVGRAKVVPETRLSTVMLVTSNAGCGASVAGPVAAAVRRRQGGAAGSTAAGGVGPGWPDTKEFHVC